MKKNQYVEEFCPKCGKEEKVTKGAELVACWRCLMRGADRVEVQNQQKSNQYDWRETLLKIRRKEQITQGVLAFTLKMSPAMLTQVKKGNRAIPDAAMGIIKEKFSKFITYKKQEVTA